MYSPPEATPLEASSGTKWVGALEPLPIFNFSFKKNYFLERHYFQRAIFVRRVVAALTEYSYKPSQDLYEAVM